MTAVVGVLRNGAALEALFSYRNDGSGDGPEGSSTRSELVVCAGGATEVEVVSTRTSHTEKASSSQTDRKHYVWGPRGYKEASDAKQCLPEGVEPTLAAFLAKWRDDWEATAGTCSTAHCEDHYAPTFAATQPKALDRKAWLADKKTKACKKKFISVLLLDVQVKPKGPDEADVAFTQEYTSDTHRDSGRKTMHLVRTKGRWLIASEDWV